MRALGLDLGSKRTGVAVSNSAGTIATPVETLRSDELDPVAIQNLVGEYNAEIVVVGMPTSLSGNQGPAATKTLKQVDTLRSHLNVPVVTFDERLTTVTANHNLTEANISSSKRRGVVDQVAATVILQSWLDAGKPHND